MNNNRINEKNNNAYFLVRNMCFGIYNIAR